MCTVIGADYLFAMVLKHKESATFGLLRGFQDEIESRLPDVVVDLSRSSIFAAFEYYSDIFERKPSGVSRAVAFADCLPSDYFDNEFASFLPPGIHHQIQEIIDTFLQTDGSPNVQLI